MPRMCEEEGPDHARKRWGAHREEFVRWHQQPSLYREIYARTVATLVAAFVIYCIAALAGVVSRRPLAVVIVLFDIVGIGATAWGLLQGRRANKRKSPEELAAFRKEERKGYLYFLLMLGVLTAISVLGHR